MKQSTQQRLNQLMSERNLKQVDILNMSMPLQERTGIKMSKSHLSQYVNGKSSPDQHKLYLLAKTLNVSEAWLLGYDVPKEDREFDVPTIETIYKRLNPERQTKVYNFAASIIGFLGLESIVQMPLQRYFVGTLFSWVGEVWSNLYIKKGKNLHQKLNKSLVAR